LWISNRLVLFLGVILSVITLGMVVWAKLWMAFSPAKIYVVDPRLAPAPTGQPTLPPQPTQPTTPTQAPTPTPDYLTYQPACSGVSTSAEQVKPGESISYYSGGRALNTAWTPAVRYYFDDDGPDNSIRCTTSPTGDPQDCTVESIPEGKTAITFFTNLRKEINDTLYYCSGKQFDENGNGVWYPSPPSDDAICYNQCKVTIPIVTPTPIPAGGGFFTPERVTCTGVTVSAQQIQPGQTLTYRSGLTSFIGGVGWLSATRYYFDDYDPQVGSILCRPNSKECSLEIPEGKQSVTIFTNLRKVFNGTTYYCLGRTGTWYPSTPPVNGTASCVNQCKVTVPIVTPTPGVTGGPDIPGRLVLGDVNGNGQFYDRGDVMCAMIQYLRNGVRPMETASRYDLDSNGRFNRQDVMWFVVRYLKSGSPMGSGACLPL